MSADLYKRPSRDEIAARVSARQPEPPGDPVAWFAVHVQAALRATGWTAADLAGRTGLDVKAITRAVNGTPCTLAVAAKIADALGRPLAVMVGPYACGTCDGHPPAGFACLECGTEGERLVTREARERSQGRERLAEAAAEAARRTT